MKKSDEIFARCAATIPKIGHGTTTIHCIPRARVYLRLRYSIYMYKYANGYVVKVINHFKRFKQQQKPLFLLYLVHLLFSSLSLAPTRSFLPSFGRVEERIPNPNDTGGVCVIIRLLYPYMIRANCGKMLTHHRQHRNTSQPPNSIVVTVKVNVIYRRNII